MAVGELRQDHETGADYAQVHFKGTIVVSNVHFGMSDRVLTHANIANVLKFQVKSGLTLKYCVIANRTTLAAHTLERKVLDNAACQ